MTCTCGCDVVEDYESRSFCTGCGSLVSDVTLVSTWTDGKEKTDLLYDVADTFRSRGLKMCDSVVNKEVRNKKRRLQNIRDACKRLRIANSDLIAETAYLHIKEDGLTKNHFLKKHIAAGIYLACKDHDLDITCEKLIEVLELPSTTDTYLASLRKEKIASPLPLTLIDFKDFETNGIIGENKAMFYHGHFVDLKQIMNSTKVRRLSSADRRIAAVLINMIFQFDSGTCFGEKELAHFDIRTESQVEVFKEWTARCWTILSTAVVRVLPWLYPNSVGRNPNRVPSRGYLIKKLDKIISNKKILIEHFEKSPSSFHSKMNHNLDEAPYSSKDGENSRVSESKCEKSTPTLNIEYNDIEISAGVSEASSGSSSSQLSSVMRTGIHEVDQTKKCSGEVDAGNYPTINLLDQDTIRHCLTSFKKFISDSRYKDITALFEKLCNILLYTELREKLLKSPRLTCSLLLYQIIAALETNVPSFAVIFNGKQKEKAVQLDHLIRLIFIKLCMFIPGLLPTKIPRDKLSGIVNLYYSTCLGEGKTYNILLKYARVTWESCQDNSKLDEKVAESDSLCDDEDAGSEAEESANECSGGDEVVHAEEGEKENSANVSTDSGIAPDPDSTQLSPCGDDPTVPQHLSPFAVSASGYLTGQFPQCCCPHIAALPTGDEILQSPNPDSCHSQTTVADAHSTVSNPQPCSSSRITKDAPNLCDNHSQTSPCHPPEVISKPQGSADHFDWTRYDWTKRK